MFLALLRRVMIRFRTNLEYPHLLNTHTNPSLILLIPAHHLTSTPGHYL